jgi:hypothetical protein
LPDDGHGGPEVVEGSCHLEPDGSGAHEHEARGKVGQEEEIVGGERQLTPIEGRDDGSRAGGDHHVLAAHLVPIDAADSRPDKPGLAEIHADAGPLELVRAGLQASDDGVLTRDDRGPVERRGGGMGAEV